MFDLESMTARLTALYGNRVREVWLTEGEHHLHVLFSDDGKNGVRLEVRRAELEVALKGLPSRRLDDLLSEVRSRSRSQ